MNVTCRELPDDLKKDLSDERKALLVPNSDRLTVPCHLSKACWGPEDIGITDMYKTEPRTAYQQKCRSRPVVEPQHYTRPFNKRVLLLYVFFVKVCLDYWQPGAFRDYRGEHYTLLATTSCH